MTLLICLWKLPDGDAVQGDVCHVQGVGKPTARLNFASVKNALRTLIAADVPARYVSDYVKRTLSSGQEWQYEHECDREHFDALMLDQARTEAVDVIRRDLEGSRVLCKVSRTDDEWN